MKRIITRKNAYLHTSFPVYYYENRLILYTFRVIHSLTLSKTS